MCTVIYNVQKCHLFIFKVNGLFNNHIRYTDQKCLDKTAMIFVFPRSKHSPMNVYFQTKYHVEALWQSHERNIKNDYNEFIMTI